MMSASSETLTFTACKPPQYFSHGHGTLWPLAGPLSLLVPLLLLLLLIAYRGLSSVLNNNRRA